MGTWVCSRCWRCWRRGWIAVMESLRRLWNEFHSQVNLQAIAKLWQEVQLRHQAISLQPTDRHYGCQRLLHDQRLPLYHKRLDIGPSPAASLGWHCWPVLQRVGHLRHSWASKTYAGQAEANLGPRRRGHFCQSSANLWESKDTPGPTIWDLHWHGAVWSQR